jgi:threonine dehydrogenase-like Zn-dependent dehydrogenase
MNNCCSSLDRVPERLAMAAEAGAETINFEEEDVYDRLNKITNGRGPDRVIEAVGMETLIQAIQEGKIDPSFVITHRCALEDEPGMYDIFKNKNDGCIKVVMRPHG